MNETEGKIMKKILIATTALVATAGVAAADVSLSGFATVGVVSGEGIYRNVTRNGHLDAGDARLETDLDLFITGTAQSDNGIAFSATINMEDLTGTNYGVGAANTTTTALSASKDGLSFTFGNTDGAADRLTNETARLYPGVRFELWGGHVDNVDAGQVARIDYTMDNGLRMSASYNGTADQLGVALQYSINGLTVGVGRENSGLAATNNKDYTVVSASYTMGDFTVSAIHHRSDNQLGVTSMDQTDFGIVYTAGAVRFGLESLSNSVSNTDNWTAFAEYDMGGGVTAFVQGGTRDYAAIANAAVVAGSAAAAGNTAALNEEGVFAAGVKFNF
jgi:outer membrane protein OmpU